MIGEVGVYLYWEEGWACTCKGRRSGRGNHTIERQVELGVEVCRRQLQVVKPRGVRQIVDVPEL